MEAETWGVLKTRLDKDTNSLLGNPSSRDTLVVGKCEHCWAEWPVLVILLCCVCVCVCVCVYICVFSGFPTADQDDRRSNWQGKPRRTPLQVLYDSDQSALSPVQALHQRRRELLEQECQAHTRKRRVLIPEDLKHLVVDDQHRLLYCYVPKVACTNWKRVLMVLTGSGRDREPLQIPASEAHLPGHLRSLAEFPPAQINRRLRTYLKFLFVREPFERLVSAYRNKFTRSYNTAFHKRYGTKIVRRHRPHPRPEALERGDDVSFPEFVSYLLDPRTQREEPFNEHWERVHALCHPCLLHYDLVGKYETLEQDSGYVLRLAGAEEVRFPASGKNTHTTGEMAAKFFHSISPLYQRKLYNLYRMDFLLFNYSAPAYLSFR
ncbi:carbohydrate sulfotransferase 13-like [Conger conger]|uniref:carbohydrate sulfotransferase 13-like n=1 Tax=Conger conger TaxID=82655 RepID=UPI002A5AB80F|nr:carbohydrate sulfotransferase 13-like [Conger conger]